MYLRGTKLAMSDLQIATLLFWAEVGGSLGAVASGFVSTRLGGRHALTCALSACVSSVALGALTWFSWTAASAQNDSAPLAFGMTCVLQAASLAGINGVRTLTGLHAAEVAAFNDLPIGMTGGFIEVVGQVGSILAGQPLGALVVAMSGSTGGIGEGSAFGWVAILLALASASAFMLVLNVVLMPQEKRRLAKVPLKVE